jgi:plastocyanin
MIAAPVVLAIGLAALAWFVTRSSGSTGRGFGPRLILAGFALVPLAIVVGAIAGNISAVGFFVALLVLIVPVTVLLWLTRRFYWASLVVAILTLLATVPVASFGLGRLDGFSDFAPSLLLVLGGVVAFAGSALAIVQRRRQRLRPITSRQRWTARAVALGVIALATASALSSTSGHTSLGSVPGATVVEMKDDRFDPRRLEANPGERVTVIAHNIDDYSHTLTIDALKVDVYVGPRADRLITFTAPGREGAVALTCVVSGHEDMRGLLVVDR